MNRRQFLGGICLLPLAWTANASILTVNGSVYRTSSGILNTANSSPSIVFDYFISPSGDDNNVGSLVSPWSITALNSKGSTYAGKKIGFIGDQGVITSGKVGGVTTTLYALYQAASANGSVLQVEGGTGSSSPTYLASCNSSGTYSARLAIIDASNPSGGASPTVEAQFIGQNQYNNSSPPSHYGDIVYDGLTIRKFTFSAICSSSPSAHSGFVVKNCEIYGGDNVPSNNNPGAIWYQSSTDAVIYNNKIHDVKTSSGFNPWGAYAIFSFLSSSIVTNNTTYNCSGFSPKDYWQKMLLAYNRFDFGSFGTGYSLGSTSLGFTGANYLADLGQTIVMHHNIIIGPVSGDGESSQENKGKVRMYNNTFYQPTYGGSNKIQAFNCDKSPADSAATWEFYNNLVFSLVGYENGGNANASLNFPAVIANPSRLPVCNYNAYGTGMTFGDAQGSWNGAKSLATWQAAGFDVNSTSLGSSPFSTTPTDVASSSYAITGPALTAGIGGVPCGAIDGSGLVGCNF